MKHNKKPQTQKQNTKALQKTSNQQLTANNTKPQIRSPTIWTFTNKRELNKSEFLNYVERKVFRTIRRYQMLPKDKIIKLKPSTDLNTIILKKILETKFQVKSQPATCNLQPTFSSSNLSQVAEDAFKNILKGKFNYKTPTNTPLIYLSDKEIELYAKLKNIKATKRKENKKIQTLFEKFLKKNQDLELNIIKATNQINETTK